MLHLGVLIDGLFLFNWCQFPPMAIESGLRASYVSVKISDQVKAQ